MHEFHFGEYEMSGIDFPIECTITFTFSTNAQFKKVKKIIEQAKKDGLIRMAP